LLSLSISPPHLPASILHGIRLGNRSSDDCTFRNYPGHWDVLVRPGELAFYWDVLVRPGEQACLSAVCLWWLNCSEEISLNRYQ
jgi:hypothetical protein